MVTRSAVTRQMGVRISQPTCYTFSMFSRIYHAPADWIVSHTSARDRRAFGFWTVLFSTIGTLFFGHIVLWVSILSVVALIPNITAETPVEHEDKQ